MNSAVVRAELVMPTLSEVVAELPVVGGWRIAWSLLLPFVWCGAYFAFAWFELWPLAVFSLVALSFVTYGSISHDLVHANLRLDRRVNDVLLFAIELLAIRSGHAYRAAHLHHHARFPHDDDVEGSAAGMPFWRAAVEGIVFEFKIIRWALNNARRDRPWILLELGGCAGIVAAAAVALTWTPIPLVYVVVMFAGSWVIPLATSYVPHDRQAQDELHQTRRFRGVLASILALEHLYHLEHHLYPTIPHHQWPALARRLDPYFDAAGVEAVRWWR